MTEYRDQNKQPAQFSLPINPYLRETMPASLTYQHGPASLTYQHGPAYSVLSVLTKQRRVQCMYRERTSPNSAGGVVFVTEESHTSVSPGNMCTEYDVQCEVFINFPSTIIATAKYASDSLKTTI